MQEVSITQYLRPSGTPTIVYAPVEDIYYDMVHHRDGGMTLSCEVLTTGDVVLYARYSNEPEEFELSEVAHNGPGGRTPSLMLQKLIARVHERRHS